MLKELDLVVEGGTITLCTESGQNIGPRGITETHLAWNTSNDHMFGVAGNTAETRRWLRAALKRMEKEAKKK